MPDLEFGCLPTTIGSMPQTDAVEACSLVTRYLKDLPAWPQLPNRSWAENMYVQFSEGFPGITVDPEQKRITVDDDRAIHGEERKKLFVDYAENDVKDYGIGEEYATGLHAFLNLETLASRAVKSQVTGPVSWGLTVTDENKNAVIYDDTLRDIIARFFSMKASWLENRLKKLSKTTITLLNEPYISACGSESVPLKKATIIPLLKEVLAGLKGIRGIHCCGSADWSLVLGIGIDILSFDAYNYAESLTHYPEEIKEFITKGGAAAWGIIPNEDEKLKSETAASLMDRLEEALAPFTRNNGLRFRTLVEQSLLTPSCSLASMSVDGSIQALELLGELSGKMRSRYI